MINFLFVILMIIICSQMLTNVIEILNIVKLKTTLPAELDEFYDQKKYSQSQLYLKTKTLFSLVKSNFFSCVTIIVILFGGFNWLDIQVRSLFDNYYLVGLFYIFSMMILSQLASFPFDLYNTFVIEEKFGFNKTTPKTFVLDLFKSFILLICIGGPIFALILWFFNSMGEQSWLYCWVAVSGIQLLLMVVGPSLIMPLFNKFEALEEGELKEKIIKYAQEQDFELKDVYMMDGSKRSSKSNAFFAGYGRFRKIVLFDTLIKQHTINELVAVLAHEIGHFKMKHITKQLLMSIVSTGFTFYAVSLLLNNESLFAAFKMDHLSVYASLVFFGFLYSPFEMMLSIFSNFLSRRHEFEADAFAVKTTGLGTELGDALKKLSVHNLANCFPHPLKVFFDYTHPPLLERLARLK